jgi:HK97 family phage portal protein
MSVVPDASGWPAAFEYSANGRTVRFSQDGEGRIAPILHVAQFHPLDDHYACPRWKPRRPARHPQRGERLEQGAARHAARPSGALVYKGENGQNLSEEQFERLRDELQANFSGAGNAGRPLLLEGGLAWQSMSLSPSDMDYMEARNGAAREIALAFGVPPMLLGIRRQHLLELQEANVALWRQTVLPLVGRVAGALERWLAPAWDGDLRLGFDLDAIEALSADRESLWRRVNEADS